jgi:hypothetical protein
MNKDTLAEITTGVMGVGYLDLEFFANTIEEYKLRVEEIIDDVEQNF